MFVVFFCFCFLLFFFFVLFCFVFFLFPCSVFACASRKHAYSNILKISPPKTEKKTTTDKYHIFYISAQKHRLLVPVRTASARRF